MRFSKLEQPPKVSKEEAIERGLSLYWTGKPCRKGHMDFRYVANGNCLTCNRRHWQRSEVKRRGILDDSSARNADARRKAEAIREEMELERELAGY